MNRERGAVFLAGLALCLAIYAVVMQSVTAFALNNRMESLEQKRLESDSKLASAIRELSRTISLK